MLDYVAGADVHDLYDDGDELPYTFGDLKLLVRREVREALKEIGSHQLVPKAILADDDMHTCVSQFPLPHRPPLGHNYESATVPSAWGNRVHLDQRFQHDASKVPGLFALGGFDQRREGLSVGDHERPSSEISSAAMEQAHTRGNPALAASRNASGDSGFRFESAAPIAVQKPPSEAAKRLVTPGVCRYQRANGSVLLGDHLLVVDKLLGVIGARRAQLSLEQMLRADRGTAAPVPKAAMRQHVAPPALPRPGVGGTASALGPAPARSKLVERSWGLYESCVRDGKAIHHPARQLELVSNNERLKRAMQSIARIYRFFDHIIEQQALFGSICGRGSSQQVQVRSDTHEEAWHALGGSLGLLVDIGAVKPGFGIC